MQPRRETEKVSRRADRQRQTDRHTDRQTDIQFGISQDTESDAASFYERVVSQRDFFNIDQTTQKWRMQLTLACAWRIE